MPSTGSPGSIRMRQPIVSARSVSTTRPRLKRSGGQQPVTSCLSTRSPRCVCSIRISTSCKARAADPHRDFPEMKMSKLISIPLAMIACVLFASAFAAEPVKTAATTPSTTQVHRYLIERTFPAGALAGLDAATKAKVNGNNASVGVRWIQSYANADKTKTFCVYEGPSEAAVRKAAQLNGLPVDSVMEVPVTLLPK